MWQDIKLLNATANFLFGLAVCVLFLIVLGLLVQRPMFTLHVIQVEGPEQVSLKHVHAEIIRTTALPRMQGNFFTTNLDQVRSAFEALPWVITASVRREWPDKNTGYHQ